ncbi:hypothetical protein PMAA_068960 [Talaromyces marneffei ATCC 18224]|uniref:Uncharacterized protein n=2 Tax=Talaromyces marneffei TaxID=37727 RepID=B6Q8J8_TALMQ|nr:hypothetical protein PMAA_068960 [Talaromyces marneffei ATCC 18224]
MAQYRSLSLYHYHVIYDIVNLTGISVCAGLINVIGTKTAHNRDRLFLVIIFICLYLAFVVIFGIRLQMWDDNLPGRCYYANRVLSLGYYHSLGDRVYLALTCAYFFLSLIFCGLVALGTMPLIHEYPVLEFLTAQQQENQSMLGHISAAVSEAARLLRLNRLFPKIPRLSRRRDKWLEVWSMPNPKLITLSLAMVQYPLHIYAVFTLRQTNENLLNGDSENYWGFGQVVALVLLASSVLQGFRAILGYYRAKKEKWFITPPARRNSA